MTKDTFIAFLQDSDIISETLLPELEEITKQYPYFQAGKSLYLKGLKQNDHFKYNQQLKETAALTVDRSVLFDYITNFEQNPSKGTEKTIAEVSIETNPIEQLPIEKLEAELEIGKPLEFTKTETHSFTQWLQLSGTKPIVRTTETVNHTNLLKKNIDLIDRFIEENPSILPVEKNIHLANSKEIILDSSGIMTETLAKVYLEQKKYASAIKAYEILILKYPEKSGFFADQIRKIEYLKTNKS